ncbi:MAG: SDR family oxidoreductase [Pseudonocardia sp.]|nr:SDR family oxidoreductase [Pseudonocardia sp.]
MDTRLDGTVALVTGASSGIGEAIAMRLAAAGSTVALVARRAAELDRVRAGIERAGGTARAIPADLLLDADIERVLARVEDELGALDILVNNAGEISYSLVHEMDFARWDDVLRLNLRTPAYLCARVLPSMRERRRGYIVNIASEAGCFVYAGLGAYAVSKHGLRALTELVQEENQDLGIKAWAVCPGITATTEADLARDPGVTALRCDDVADVVLAALTEAPHLKTGPTLLLRTMRPAYSALDLNPTP